MSGDPEYDLSYFCDTVGFSKHVDCNFVYWVYFK